MRDVGTIENGVLFGRNGQLFLSQGGHFILDIVTGRRQVPDESFENFHANILGRLAHTQRLDGKFVHVIFPDKQSVLQSEFPVENCISLGDVYLSRFPEITKHVLYLADLMRSQPVGPYQLTDTHMTDRAVAIAAASIAETIAEESQAERLAELLGKLTIERTVTGDLGRRIQPQESGVERFIAVDWETRRFGNDISGGNDGIVDLYFSQNAPYKRRILWFGDSFGRGCTKLLSFFFSEIAFLRTRFFHREICDQMRPDVVVTQSVERYMDYCYSDEEAPVFLMYPHLKELQYNPTVDFATAFSALLSYPRRPYADFIGSLGRS